MFDPEQDAYKELRSIVKERTRPISFWVGAGLSASGGLPTWGKLREEVITATRDDLNALNPEDPGAEAKRRRLREAARVENLWVAMQILQEIAPLTFEHVVRRALSPGETSAIPDIYTMMARLRPRGVLSLNLDRFLERAFAELCPEVLAGNGFRNAQAVLQNTRPFLALLHGRLTDRATWVLTQDELKALVSNKAYQTFVENCVFEES